MQVVGEGRKGLDVRAGDPKEGAKARHRRLFALCWDDWESGARDKVQAMMESERRG
jgi:hypothetical protein